MPDTVLNLVTSRRIFLELMEVQFRDPEIQFFSKCIDTLLFCLKREEQFGDCVPQINMQTVSSHK